MAEVCAKVLLNETAELSLLLINSYLYLYVPFVHFIELCHLLNKLSSISWKLNIPTSGLNICSCPFYYLHHATTILDPLALRTAVIFHGIDSIIWLKHSTEILVHANVKATGKLLHISWLYIHDANLPFCHIPKVLCWIKIRWLWRSLWHGVIASIRRWVHCSNKGMDMINNNIQVGCDV